MNAPHNEDHAAESRLGQPRELADAAVANYRAARLAGRHPWLTFLVAPLPVLILTWAAAILIGLGLVKGVPVVLGEAYQIEGKTMDQWPQLLIWIAAAFDFSLKFVLPAVVVGLFAYLAGRGGQRARWVVLACVLIALVASGLQTNVQAPQTPGGRGQYTIGLGIGLHVPSIMCLIQFTIPLVAGCAFALLRRASARDANLG